MLLGRLPLLVVLLIAVAMAVFALTLKLPGDPAFIAAGGGDATPEMIAHARARLGLDRPAWIRFVYYVRNVAQGRKSDMRHNLCKVDERWRLVGDVKPGEKK